METVTAELEIRDSFLEHRQSFTDSWVDRWVLPNPFVKVLQTSLKNFGVELTDFSFNKDAPTLGDAFLNVSIRRLSAAARIGLDSITFSAAHPAWEDVPKLVSAFEQVSRSVREIVCVTPATQETSLALHVASEPIDFGTRMASLVRKELLGEAVFYGISLHRKTGIIMIDKSLRFERSAFIRIQRTSLGDDSLAEIASKIYEDEVFALRLLGLVDKTEVTQ